MRVQHNRQGRLFEVSPPARKLTARAGTQALRALADQVGLTDALAEVCRGRHRRGYDPGGVLRTWRSRSPTAGCASRMSRCWREWPGEPVVSDSTAWRLVNALADDNLVVERLGVADWAARGCVWPRLWTPPPRRLRRRTHPASTGRPTMRPPPPSTRTSASSRASGCTPTWLERRAQILASDTPVSARANRNRIVPGASPSSSESPGDLHSYRLHSRIRLPSPPAVFRPRVRPLLGRQLPTVGASHRFPGQVSHGCDTTLPAPARRSEQVRIRLHYT